MEGHVLPGDAFPGEDAAVLRGTFSDHGNQLQLPAHSERKDAHELVGEHAREIPLQPQGAAGDYALSQVARLRGSVGEILGNAKNLRRETRPGAVPVAAIFKKRSRLAERFPGDNSKRTSERL